MAETQPAYINSPSDHKCREGQTSWTSRGVDAHGVPATVVGTCPPGLSGLPITGAGAGAEAPPFAELLLSAPTGAALRMQLLKTSLPCSRKH